MFLCKKNIKKRHTENYAAMTGNYAAIAAIYAASIFRIFEDL